MEISYDNSKDAWNECLNNAERHKHSLLWLNPYSLDRLRHNDLLSCVLPLIKDGNTFLTLGDGRYGTDAIYLASHGANVHASDVSDILLAVSYQKGLIQNYSEENAESLSFPDESFDYVVIKEALHHCPRPWIALHEAFRVCRKAVILMEPSCDSKHTMFPHGYIINLLLSFPRFAKDLARILIYRKPPYKSHWFEPVGNYGFTFSQYELEKFLLGMHFNSVSFRMTNDIYFKGIESVDLSANSIITRFYLLKFRVAKSLKNYLARLGFIGYDRICAALHKEKPEPVLIKSMKKSGWRYRVLPFNPYSN